VTASGVHVTRHGGALHVVLDDPARRNALSRRTLARLHEILSAVDDTVTGVVLSGQEDVFSAGADFNELTGTAADASFDDAVTTVTRIIRELPRVVIAALEGPCIGAAADLALACDLRVAAQGSYLTVPAVRLGLLYNPEAVDQLRRAYPRDSVRRLLLLGERFDAEEALNAGLVSQVAPRGEAAKRALELLADTTADHLEAVAATKALLHDQESGTPDLAHWAERRRQLLDSPARKAAVEQARHRHSAPHPKAQDHD
jgi:enoyl-CoA hydratase/carnithine racemase